MKSDFDLQNTQSHNKLIQDLQAVREMTFPFIQRKSLVFCLYFFL